MLNILVINILCFSFGQSNVIIGPKPTCDFMYERIKDRISYQHGGISFDLTQVKSTTVSYRLVYTKETNHIMRVVK